MSIFGLFEKKTKREAHVFTDEERDKSANSRLLNSIKKTRLEIQRQELEHYRELLEEKKMQQEISYMKSNLYDDEEQDDYDDEVPDFDNPENMLMQILSKVISSKFNIPSQQQTNTPTSSIDQITSPSVVDEGYIQQQVQKIPKEYLEQTKKMTDIEISNLVLERYPSLSNEAVIKTVEIIKNAANAK